TLIGGDAVQERFGFVAVGAIVVTVGRHAFGERFGVEAGSHERGFRLRWRHAELETRNVVFRCERAETKAAGEQGQERMANKEPHFGDLLCECVESVPCNKFVSVRLCGPNAKLNRPALERQRKSQSVLKLLLEPACEKVWPLSFRIDRPIT